ncbi:hypothetical protein [Alteribacillus persepolensis]|uniref:hypothetical protein n=1 Tax=Alteribacillus persepolensis TaxID=568899 RepID=UPI00111342BE|nr:hypothetical protein [Alteribacillus persepolensis]
MMFLKHLIAINKEFNLPPTRLRILDDELTLLKPGTNISPHYLYRKTKINTEIIKIILIELSFVSPYIKENFIIFCENEDREMVHGFEFSTKKELKNFILKNGHLCPECDYSLKTSDIRVSFKKINSEVIPDKVL